MRFVSDVTRIWPSIAVTTALLALLAPAAQGAFPGRNGFIAYEHFGSSSADEEGSGPTTSGHSLVAGRLLGQERFTLRSCTEIDQVPQEPACSTSFADPAYSARGDFLLVDAGKRLAMLRSDGGDFHLLPQQTADDGAPAWAPDGLRFVFTGVAEGASQPDLYVFNIPRGTSRRLTTTGGAQPAWSSRNRIVYVAGYSQPFLHLPTGHLATIKPDGSGRRVLTRKNGVAPNWSPHGTKIAFIRKGRLYVIGANGKGLRRVGGPRFSFDADDVTWSPDGRFLAFHNFESGIMAVDARGRHEYEFEGAGYSPGSSYDALAPDGQPIPRPPRR